MHTYMKTCMHAYINELCTTGVRSGGPQNFGAPGGQGNYSGLPPGGQGGYNPGPLGGGGYDGPPPSAFDPSDFPSLGGRGGGPGQLGAFDGDVSGVSLQQKEFSMEDDFPALPGAPGGGGQAANNSLMTGGAGAGGMGAGMVEQFQRMKLESQNYAGEQGGVGGPGGLAAQAAGQDKYGLLGLLR